MFEKEAEEYAKSKKIKDDCIRFYDTKKHFKDGAEFGYNKGKEDVKYDLMMKFKDEGIVKPLKESILRNERLSSQEQQELCAWIECAMEFGENLDKCAKELEEVNKANEWHFVSKEGHPNKDDIYLIIRSDGLHLGDYCCGGDGDIDCQSWCDYPSEEEIQDDSVIAWKEIVLPE